MDHKDLDAWKQAMLLVEDVYKVTSAFPKEEIYGLTAQLRRSAVSVPSNLSEGAGRKSSKEFNNFLSISLGSLAELETPLHITANRRADEGAQTSNPPLKRSPSSLPLLRRAGSISEHVSRIHIPDCCVR
ncbi:MAG: hypothetical protein A2W25_03240 [candidate division Zixibacteria bacterium RBG_16_53_22]|nr:MAG: hypothetical protein A2W25_03240 [candidate division Zixibacteria bacterium RBG_16_53_22]